MLLRSLIINLPLISEEEEQEIVQKSKNNDKKYSINESSFTNNVDVNK